MGDSFHKRDYHLLSDAEWEAFKKGAAEVPEHDSRHERHHGRRSFWDDAMEWLFGKPDHDRRAEWKHGREERRDQRHGKGGKGRGHHGRHGEHGKHSHRDHRPKRRPEPKYEEWTLDEDDYLVMQWEDEMEDAYEADWEPMMDEDFEPAQEPPPHSLGAPHRRGIDMTTLDKRHGGRHLRCGWGKPRGDGNGAGFHGRGHHHGRRGFLHHARCSIIMGAVLFTVMIAASLCVHKKSIKARRRYERLSEVHESAVERNLNDKERNQLYRQVAESSCRQRAALRRQMRAQPPTASNG